MPHGTSQCAYAVVVGWSQRVSRVMGLLPARDVRRGEKEQAASLGLGRVQVLEPSTPRVKLQHVRTRPPRRPIKRPESRPGDVGTRVVSASTESPRELHADLAVLSAAFQKASRSSGPWTPLWTGRGGVLS